MLLSDPFDHSITLTGKGHVCWFVVSSVHGDALLCAVVVAVPRTQQRSWALQGEMRAFLSGGTAETCSPPSEMHQGPGNGQKAAQWDRSHSYPPQHSEAPRWDKVILGLQLGQGNPGAVIGIGSP